MFEYFRKKSELKEPTQEDLDINKSYRDVSKKLEEISTTINNLQNRLREILPSDPEFLSLDELLDIFIHEPEIFDERIKNLEEIDSLFTRAEKNRKKLSEIRKEVLVCKNREIIDKALRLCHRKETTKKNIKNPDLKILEELLYIHEVEQIEFKEKEQPLRAHLDPSDPLRCTVRYEKILDS